MESEKTEPARNSWLASDDAALLAQCDFNEYQASGPGGQKRNRKYSAVRLKHRPTGIEVTAAESRSGKQNRSAALKKLRCSIAVSVRAAAPPVLNRKEVSCSSPDYPLFLASVFDAMHKYDFRISEAAEELGYSTGRLVKLLYRDGSVWQKINEERKKRNLTPLKGK